MGLIILRTYYVFSQLEMDDVPADNSASGDELSSQRGISYKSTLLPDGSSGNLGGHPLPEATQGKQASLSVSRFTLSSMQKSLVRGCSVAAVSSQPVSSN